MSKRNWGPLIGCLAFVIAGGACVVYLYSKPLPGLGIDSAKALRIAAATPEVKGLYRLKGGALSACVTPKVVTSCESDYVTCMDNGWVVQYEVPPACGIEHDGRLGVNLLMDKSSGKIISRYPEAEYFGSEWFCRQDADCSSVDISPREVNCLNFIHAPFYHPATGSAYRCRCQKGSCDIAR